MRWTGRLFAILVILGALYTSVSARTWIVSKDGTGDFSVIQDAVDAASDGDIISIRAGRYEEYHVVSEAPTLVAYVEIRGKSLELIGEGAGGTIIGPSSPDHHSDPGTDVTIIEAQDFETLRISSLGFEHSPWRMINAEIGAGRLEVDNCVFRVGHSAIGATLPGGGRVENCQFTDLESKGVLLWAPTATFDIRECVFSEVRLPVFGAWSPVDCVVADCSMDGGVVGVTFVDGAGGAVMGCSIRMMSNYGVALSDCGAVNVRDNLIEGDSGWGMVLAYSGSSVIEDNVISTITGTCLFLPSPNDHMRFTNNDLRRGDGFYVKTTDYWPYEPPVFFDLKNNHWGTTDLEEIEEYIIDGNDDPEVNMFVLFDPIADDPVRTESRTWSSIKSLFESVDLSLH